MCHIEYTDFDPNLFQSTTVFSRHGQEFELNIPEYFYVKALQPPNIPYSLFDEILEHYQFVPYFPIHRKDENFDTRVADCSTRWSIAQGKIPYKDKYHEKQKYFDYFLYLYSDR